MKAEKLNLVMSYPVKWTAYGVLRDFIQNFFDAVGPERFGQDFVYCYEEGSCTLTMHAETGFARDWLMYIGASSKRDKKDQVGKFGEGFKIASLVAFRDFGWDITMESLDWKLHVTEAEDLIDGTAVKVLAYEVEERSFSKRSVLTLRNIGAESMKDFHLAMEAFCYEGNTRFGEVIAKTDQYAVYTLSEESLSSGSDGVLFSQRLHRAYLHAPLVVCNHTYEAQMDGRERDWYSNRDTERCVMSAFQKITPEEAGKVLRIVRKYWSYHGASKCDFCDWEPLVKLLIRRVAESREEKERFCQEFGKELTADFAVSNHGNRRKLALQWMRFDTECRERHLVYHEFRILGIRELDDLCKEHGGYEQIREPRVEERQYLDILNRMARDVFRGFTCYEELPQFRIITNCTLNNGSACHYGPAVKQKNCLGITTRYDIRTVQLRSELFERDKFPEAAVVYMHELLHQLGGDGSIQFRRAITATTIRMAQEAERLSVYQREWEKVGSQGESEPV